MGKLTKEQIENWRKILYLQIGPAALTLSEAKIQAMRDGIQGRVDALVPKNEFKPEAKESFGVREPEPVVEKKQEPLKATIGDILKAKKEQGE